MACFKRCCCCVDLRLGGMMLGVTTLALSIFSLIPMALFLVYRVFLAQVVIRLVEQYGAEQATTSDGNLVESVTFWGTVNEALNSQTVEDNLPPEDSNEVNMS